MDANHKGKRKVDQQVTYRLVFMQSPELPLYPATVEKKVANVVFVFRNISLGPVTPHAHTVISLSSFLPFILSFRLPPAPLPARY